MDEEELLDALAGLYEKALLESTGTDVIELGMLSVAEISAIQAQIGKTLTGFRKIVKFNNTRHIVKMHGKEHEKISGQVCIEPEHFTEIPNVLLNYSSIEFQPLNHSMGKHQDTIKFEKGNYTVVMEIIWGKKELSLKTIWVKK
jgi:hypothetical protein